jgi:hypothetical protein
MEIVQEIESPGQIEGDFNIIGLFPPGVDIYLSHRALPCFRRAIHLVDEPIFQFPTAR